MTGHVAFPFAVGADGRTASVGRAEYLHDLIELTLFTAPGERINRPDFGAGADRLVFAASGSVAADAAVALIEAALQRSLHDVIDITGVEAYVDHSLLRFTVSYIDRVTKTAATAHVERAT